MNATNSGTIIYEIIRQTPFYVWILLLYLIKRGLSAMKTKQLSLKKMLIMPIVFTCWGLDKMFLHFSNLGRDFIFYFAFLCVGTMIGYFIYQGRKVFYQNNTYYRSGSGLPLIIIVINFSVKYILNVLVAIWPSLYQTSKFCTTYSLLSGLSVGLFFGGLLQIYVAFKDCENQRFGERFLSE